MSADRRPIFDREPGQAPDVTYVGILLGHGGDALQMLELARGVQSQGRAVQIIVPATPEANGFQERCDRAGVRCLRTPLLSVTMDGARVSVPAAVRLMRAVRSPIVHVHTGNCHLPRNLMTALELLHYRSAVVTLQSPFETMEPGSARARFWAAMARRRMAAVVSPSEHGRRFQVRCGVPERLTAMIRNSIDIQRFGGGDPSGPRATLGVGEDVPIVLFSSRLDPQKRPVEAVEIFAGIAETVPPALLVFLGSGECEAETRAEAARLGLQDRVWFAGYQTNIADWLAVASVWLLPTERENFSVAVLEALAAGCTVLSTDCPGNDEVLLDDVNALVFPVGDVRTAQAKLAQALGDATLRARLGSAARATAEQFSADRMVEDYLALYVDRVGAVARTA